MTVLTITLPAPPDPQTLQRLMRELGATAVKVQEDATASIPTDAEIIARGGSVDGINELLAFHTLDRSADRSLPGRD